MFRILPNGPARQRVCKACAALATPVLASNAAARCEQCGTELAAFCRGCIAAVVQVQMEAKMALHQKITGPAAARELVRGLVKQTHRKRRPRRKTSK